MTFRDNGVAIRNRNGFDGQGLAFDEFDEIVEHIDVIHEISFDTALRCITETVRKAVTYDCYIKRFFLSLSLDEAPEKPLGAMPEKVVK